jgi:DNA-binding SARP family transcriptional activator
VGRRATVDRVSPRYAILGPLAVDGADGSVRLGGPRQRSLLAVLLLHANRVVSIDHLAEQLYGEEPPVTAVTQVHRQVSELRRVLGQEAIETRPPGYRLPVASGQLDLERFERLTGEAAADLARGDAARGGAAFREALDLWRGEPLADLAFEPFAAPAIARLQELRLAAIEARIEADLALGRTTDLVAELDALVAEHPLREHLHGQRILALYRAGRQREALDAYRDLRRALVDAFGIEPTPPLQDLERRILRHDPELHAAAASPPAARTRSILVAAHDGGTLDALLQIAEPLAAAPVRELVVVQLVDDADALPDAAARLATRRARLAPQTRAAAFTSADPAADILRLEAAHEADLVLLGDAGRLDGPTLPDALVQLLSRAAADVAILAAAGRPGGTGIAVPFAGGDHDWAAVETAAWFAQATGQELRLAGALTDDRGGRRDASRLLADASLAIQRLVGIDAVPHLVEPGVEPLLAALDGAALVVAGLSPRWRADGLGAVRRELASRLAASLLLVHRGVRPGGLSPPAAATRYSWSAGG